MKICIIGDLHFGKKNFDKNLYEMQIEYFQYIINEMKNQGIDTFIQLGDFFDNRRVMDNAFIQRLKSDVKDLFNDINFYILVGNHDIYYKNSLHPHSLNYLSDLNVKIVDEVKIIDFAGKRILFVPWIVDENMDYSKYEVDYIVGHFEIGGFHVVKNHLYEGKQLQIHPLVKKVFSGHFHLRQEKDKILYVGTPYQLDWNDSGDRKGIYILDTKNGGIQFIENRISPRFVEIRVKDEIESEIDPYDIDELKKHRLKIILEKESEYIDFLRENGIQFALIDNTIQYDVQSESSSPIEVILDSFKEIDNEVYKRVKELLEEL